MKKVRFIPLAFILMLAACSTTKNIPEGSYLLDDMEIKHDTKNATSDLEDYVRQKPNSSLPLFGKVGLKIYNMAGDTSKWINRAIRNIGQAPVLFSSSQTLVSEDQLVKQLRNQGYLNAVGDTLLKVDEKNKKIKVTYVLNGGDPYHIRDYKYNLSDTTMARIMTRVPSNPLLNKGDMYDMAMLEEERLRVNTIMRNVGYYNFSKEYVYFRADSTLNSHEVDLYLDVYPRRDSLPYPRYKINKVTVISGINSLDNTGGTSGGQLNTNRWFFRNADTTEYKDLTIIRGRNKFLRNSSIKRNNYIRKGAYYSDLVVDWTYQAYSKMGAIRQVNITTTPSSQDSTLLDATVVLLPANAHWFKAGLDGTNSAGDIGIAPSISYQHQNLFNGAEQLSIRLKGAYEFITGKSKSDLLGKNYYEYGIETSLTFPQFLFPWLKKSWREQPTATTKFSIGLTNQHRPEYTRQFFNGTINYGWATYKFRLRHTLDFLDINYIRMPWVSQRFDSLYLSNEDNPFLRESYRDQLVTRTAYTITLTNGRRLNPLYPTYTLRGSIEVSGVLPRLVTTMNGADKDEYGQKKILGVAYAEYVKGSIEYARTFYFSRRHSLAYRAGLGLAHPYGNSTVLPFERRFFAGGANSIRGWSTRSLGPGSYRRPDEGASDFVNQTGDMKLEFNIENRLKLTSLIEFAQFIDAGNIWTLKKYESQPGGQFKLNSFYKEIAASYGLGLRFDLSFLLLRLDVGAQIYNPGRESKKFVLFNPSLNKMAWHFGIGYPF